MPYLSAGGTISYNGYSFLGPRNSVRLQVIPVRDSTGRYVVHTLYRFSVEAFITADTNGADSQNGTDASTHLLGIRGALSQDGGALTISGFGFGDVTVNTARSNRDVNWGPKTQLLDMRSVGNGCVIIKWVVEVATKTCYNGGVSGILGRISEYVYSVNWTIQPNGCTVRNVRGYLKIFNAKDIQAAGNLGGGVISQTADDYREFVTVPEILGFMRNAPQSYTLDERMERISFSVTDIERESDNAYPAGVANIELNETVSSTFPSVSIFGAISGGISGAKLGAIGGEKGAAVGAVMGAVSGGINLGGTRLSFSGVIEMAKPFPVASAWPTVWKIIYDRAAKFKLFGVVWPLPTSISMTESIFKRYISFNVEFATVVLPGWFFIPAAYAQFSGLGSPVTTTSDFLYQQSMQLANRQRGYAGLVHNKSSEWFPQTCDSEGQPISITDNQPSVLQVGQYSVSDALDCSLYDGLYVSWKNVIAFDQKADSVNMQQMPLNATGASTTVNGKFDGADIDAGSSGSKKHTIVSSGDSNPRLLITLNGGAIRVGQKPELPTSVKTLNQNGDSELLRASNRITIAGYTPMGCIMYAATWFQTYAVTYKTGDEMQAALNAGIDAVILNSTQVPDSAKKGAVGG